MEQNTPAIAVIEQLLGRIDRLRLPENWAGLTPSEIGLDSIDIVELQLDLESAFEIELLEDAVTASPLTELTMSALAAHIESLRPAGL